MASGQLQQQQQQQQQQQEEYIHVINTSKLQW
jgi:hypothetical protein